MEGHSGVMYGCVGCWMVVLLGLGAYILGCLWMVEASEMKSGRS